jgi:hypothetical protein
MKTYFRHSDGRTVSEDEATAGGHLRPGFGLRSGLMAMDSNPPAYGHRLEFRDNDLERLVAERAGLIVEARRILGESYEAGDKPASDIKRDVVSKVVGPEARDLSGDRLHGAYVAAIHVARNGGTVAARSSDAQRETAYERHVASLQSAWKGDRH